MGDSPKGPLHVDFDRLIKLEFHGSTFTSDAGLLGYRELDNTLSWLTRGHHGCRNPLGYHAGHLPWNRT